MNQLSQDPAATFVGILIVGGIVFNLFVDWYIKRVKWNDDTKTQASARYKQRRYQ